MLQGVCDQNEKDGFVFDQHKYGGPSCVGCKTGEA